MKVVLLLAVLTALSASKFVLRKEIPLDELPLVSVVITSYNRGTDLAQSVESIKQQENYTNWEIIIVDENSNDTKTLKVLDFYANDPKIRIVKINETYPFSTIGKNVGLSHAKGEFVCFIDDDSYAKKDHLASHIKVFKKKPKLDFMGGPITVINEDQEITMNITHNITQQITLRFLLIFQNPIPSPTMFIRLERIRDRIVFPNNSLGDYHLFHDLFVNNTPGVYQPVFQYHDHVTTVYRNYNHQRPKVLQSYMSETWRGINVRKAEALMADFPEIFKEPSDVLSNLTDFVCLMKKYAGCFQRNVDTTLPLLMDMRQHYVRGDYFKERDYIVWYIDDLIYQGLEIDKKLREDRREQEEFEREQEYDEDEDGERPEEEEEEDVEIDEFDPEEARASITAAFGQIMGKGSMKTALIVEQILSGMIEQVRAEGIPIKGEFGPGNSTSSSAPASESSESTPSQEQSGEGEVKSDL